VCRWGMVRYRVVPLLCINAHTPADFPPSMSKNMLEVFDACAVAYNEVIISTAPGEFAIEAVIGGSKEWHNSILAHFGLNERQLPQLWFGPGLKGPAPLFA
jgi:hypothetical protein